MENETEGVEHGATLGEEALAHAETGMPQLDPSIYPNLIFWLLISIGLLYLILTRVVIPRLSEVLAERSDAISNDLEQAQFLKRRAEEADAAFDESLAKARDEAHRVAADTRAQIDRELATLMAKAEAEIGARGKESEARIADIRDSAARSVEEVARETARAIVAHLAPSASDEAATDAAVAGRMKG